MNMCLRALDLAGLSRCRPSAGSVILCCYFCFSHQLRMSPYPQQIIRHGFSICKREIMGNIVIIHPVFVT